MKWLIASDIHGSAYYCEQLVHAYHSHQAQRLVLLGDILYHGPRNPLPRDYAPQQVVALLHSLKEEILCVRGNCDTEVDQMVLPFPVLADYALLCDHGQTVFATHGHHYHPACLPPLKKGDIFLYGHTHVPEQRATEDHLFLNPGSVSLPKENSAHAYLIWDNGVFSPHELT